MQVDLVAGLGLGRKVARVGGEGEPFYRRSSVAVVGMATLARLERVLPPASYQAVYRTGVSAYRWLRRVLYRRRWLSAVLTGRMHDRRRAVAVIRVMPYSLVGPGGLEATYDAVTAINRERLSGGIVECGVAQGGSALLMAMTDREQRGHRRIWLCDSFEGLPDPTAEDYEGGATGIHYSQLVRGSCLGTEKQVSQLLFQRFGLDGSRVTFVKGWFQDTLAGLRDRIRPIALLRIDADWYESVKCCLDNLFDLVQPGGIVIIDDYGSCFGAQKAVDGFLEARGIRVSMVHDGRGGCCFRKPV